MMQKLLRKRLLRQAKIHHKVSVWHIDISLFGFVPEPGLAEKLPIG
jgi:hypothetical protein